MSKITKTACRKCQKLEQVVAVVRKMKARCDRLGDREHWYSANADDLTELFQALSTLASE